MELLETGIIIVHVLVSLALVGLVLLQQGKGAEAGASFGGGASQTVFGSQGTGGFLAKATSWLAVVFFFTSISLAYVAKQKAEVAAQGEQISIPVEQASIDSDSAAIPAGEFEQSAEEFGAALEEGIEKQDLGFAENAEAKTEELEAEAQSQVPELE